jgi:hypothetical protein
MNHLFQETVNKNGKTILIEPVNDIHRERVSPNLRFAVKGGRATLDFTHGTLSVDRDANTYTLIPGTTRRTLFSANTTRLVFD